MNSLIENSEYEDYIATLDKYGYAKDDFTYIENYEATRTELLPITGEVTITFIKTGVNRSYSIGYGSHWVAEFEADLKAFREKLLQRQVLVQNLTSIDQLTRIVHELEYDKDVKRVYIRSFCKPNGCGLLSIELTPLGFDRLSDKLKDLKNIKLDILQEERFVIKTTMH